MQEALFELERLALGPNLSIIAQPPGGDSNLSASSRWATPGQPARTTTAAAILLLALVGNGLLLHQLGGGGPCCCCCCGNPLGRRRRKVDFLLAHLAVADLYGCGLALLSQLPPAAHEAGGEEWLSGDAACRLLRLLQGSGLLAPAHMLVLIALERRQAAAAAARGPARSRPPSSLPARGALAALGWLLALLLALPQAFVFRRASPPPPPGGSCRSIFAQLPRGHGQAYAVYGALTGFVAPACLLGGTCGRILWALSNSRAKEEEEEEEEEEAAPRRDPAGGSARHGAAAELHGVASGAPPRRRLLLLRRCPVVAKCLLPSPPLPPPPPPRTLPRARARSLQLTLALATLFALCGFPRFLLELSVAFGPGPGGDDEGQASLVSLLAATHAALNPYVCLVFHSHRPWARRLQRSLCRCPDGQPRRRARHRYRPPPPPLPAEGPAGRWLCPCQTKQQPSVPPVAPREEAGESGF
ncbi:hypothetical protein JRQ81_013703 [Phrynocephalus forsythii]|uniref:G-protein coupled receptors family 1 profile domain-containing protein n=1 Tax=Phrynocephalus forsythii TaxID=171643 RepID=A0A9Q1B4I8_9SAUR|nr:hypothetical protein JRQ81_013703 [Phrynocephalus forsythii]